MKASDWIKVEDRLPERIDGLNVTHNVLVRKRVKQSYDAYYIAFYSYKEGDECWYDTMGWKILDVTHWLPIVPPKKD